MADTVSRPATADPLSPAFSLYLEALRVGAAFAVVFYHMAEERITGGRWEALSDSGLGRDAVVVFFVLSGLIIARAAGRPGTTLGGFLFDRGTRLWSVALPALILGFLLDRWGLALAPDLYAGFQYEDISLARTLALGLSFANEWWMFGERLGTNGPYWSLSHEAAYYVLFAFAVFLKGWPRVLALLAGALLTGPAILLFAPAWLLGVWVWRRMVAGELPRGREAWTYAVGGGLLAVGGTAGGLGIYVTSLTINTLGHDLLQIVRFSLSAPWGIPLAVFVSLHLLGVAGLLEGRDVRDRPWLRWLAGGTFSLYLVHAPVMQFAWAQLDGMAATPLRDAIIAGITIGACYVFAAPFERTIAWQRRTLLRAWRRLARKTKKGPPLGGPYHHEITH